MFMKRKDVVYTQDAADYLVLEEIDKIVRDRWRIIERTTRYGWLTACSRGPSISLEDATTLSALATKVGYDNCTEALRQIRKACRDLHPYCIPEMAITVLDEMYTVVILRKRGRESKWHNTSLRDLPPTVFTISKAIF